MFLDGVFVPSSGMLEDLFFALGLVNSLFLIGIFTIRGTRGIDPLRRIGPFYLLLAIPAVLGLYLVSREQKAWEYALFLGVFVVYLAVEGLFDFVWKIPFREDWKPLVPYLALYFVMNYGFVAMVWKTSLTEGLLLGALFAIQIVVNALTHGPMRGRRPRRTGVA